MCHSAIHIYTPELHRDPDTRHILEHVAPQPLVDGDCFSVRVFGARQITGVFENMRKLYISGIPNDTIYLIDSNLYLRQIQSARREMDSNTKKKKSQTFIPQIREY